MSKINGIIAEAIKAEQSYQEGKRLDWAFTKKLMRQMIDDLFPEGTKIGCNAGGITIRVPWGIENIRQARKAMGSGWKFSNNYTDTSGTLTKSYYRYDESVEGGYEVHRPYVYLSLIMDATELQENTCKRIEVGEKTFTQKIYQVICDDGFTEVTGQAEELDQDKKVTM